jgi:hypothetical protein
MKKIFLLLLIMVNTFVSYPAKYYVSSAGSDDSAGTSIPTAWLTTTKVSATVFNYDTIYFKGGESFAGAVSFDSLDSGSAASPMLITSYGTGKATIAPAGANHGIYVHNSPGYEIRNINVKGDSSFTAGQRAIYFYTTLTSGSRLPHIRVDSCNMENATNGVSIFAANTSTVGFSDVQITNCIIHQILFAGIGVSGVATGSVLGNRSHRDIYIGDCLVYNVLGYTTNTGNGISVSGTQYGTIEYCEVYNCGTGNVGTAGGPVGIITYRSDSIAIQWCISHHNATGPSNYDGSGFDIDGGSNDCIMQYNYAYCNQGIGFFLGNFTGATTKHRNTVRYNISENNGLRNNYGGIGFWSQSGNLDSACFVYNNVVYTSTDSVISGLPRGISLGVGAAGTYTNIKIHNNIIICKDNLAAVNINPTTDFKLANNLYYSDADTMKFIWGASTYTSLASWVAGGGDSTGINSDPLLINPGVGERNLTPRTMATLLNAYKLGAGSPATDAGVDINSLYGISVGSVDFYGNSIPQNVNYDIGANEYIAPLCTLTIATTTGGTVLPSGAVSDTCGDTTGIKATGNPGYSFSHWNISSNIGILDSINDTTKIWNNDFTSGTVTAYFTQNLTPNNKGSVYRNNDYLNWIYRNKVYR